MLPFFFPRCTDSRAPRNRFSQLNNSTASVCLSLTDSKAITDGNLKLILGLIWTLILHYSISMPVWEGEDEEVGIQSPTSPVLTMCPIC